MVIDDIRAKLEVLNPTLLEIEDFSQSHRGHKGVQGQTGVTHIRIKIVSDQFRGLSRLQRHRLVYNLLQDHMQTHLHAVSIQAFSSESDMHL